MEAKLKKFIESVLKGVGIAMGGGGIALGSGYLNYTDVDFGTIVVVVLFSTIFNTVYQFVRTFLGNAGK